MKNHRWPILTLFFLSPMVGELLSGSAPPAEFFNPFGLIMLSALYGSGALLIRELVRRWDKGWASILLLGMAYGIYEEGIVVRSFFDPAWQDLGILAEYGRWLGVNWMWSIELTFFHALVSITIPIMLVELMYPSHRQTPWLHRRGLITFSLLLLSLLAISPLMGMQASPLALLSSALAMGVLTLLAYLWPHSEKEPKQPSNPVSARWFALMGFVGTLGWVITLWIMPELNFPTLPALFLAVIWPLFIAIIIWVLSTRGWGDIQKWGLVFGVLLIFILLTFVAEAENLTRPDNTSGMALVGISFFTFLTWLGFRIRRRILHEVEVLPDNPQQHLA